MSALCRRIYRATTSSSTTMRLCGKNRQHPQTQCCSNLIHSLTTSLCASSGGSVHHMLLPECNSLTKTHAGCFYYGRGHDMQYAFRRQLLLLGPLALARSLDSPVVWKPSSKNVREQQIQRGSPKAGTPRSPSTLRWRSSQLVRLSTCWRPRTVESRNSRRPLGQRNMCKQTTSSVRMSVALTEGTADHCHKDKVPRPC